MAVNDIYDNKKRYDHFVKTYHDLVYKPGSNPSDKSDKKRKYFCKNPDNIKYIPKLLKNFDIKDLSYIRRLRLLSVFKIILHVMSKDLAKCDRDEIDDVIAFMHSVYPSAKSKRDFILDTKHIWKILFPEVDERGRIDDNLVPYPVRHLSCKIDRAKITKKNDRITIEEFEQLLQAFALDPRIQAYLALAWESIGRPQEILYRRFSNIEYHDNYLKIYITDHGKEGANGFLRVIDSYPYVMRWLNQHPLRNQKEKDPYIFINTGDTNKYEQLKPATINKHLREKCKELGWQKKLTNYSIKHFGVTFKREIGSSDADIQHTARWNSTAQLKTYDYSDADTMMKIQLAKRGLIKDKRFEEFTPKIRKCTFCDTTNAMTDMHCSNCKRPLDVKVIQQEQERIEQMARDLETLKKNLVKQEVKNLVKKEIMRQLKK